jgi:hypothetical protein
MKDSDENERIYTPDDHLNLPLSDEAAWHIYQFLFAFIQQFEERYYSHIERHSTAEWAAHKEAKQTVQPSNEIPWDDDIPF